MSQKGEQLYGLVLAGGKSTRMNRDKSLIEYHGVNQTEYCCKLLSRFCAKVFVSNRRDQSHLKEHKDYPQIHDICSNIGPLGGILSAITQHPHVSWLVLACDLPYVDDKVIKTLIDKRDPMKNATAYLSANDRLPEPLCAIYEGKIISRLLDALTDGTTCPRKILINADTSLIELDQKNSLDNINNPDEFDSVCKVLHT